MIHILNLPYTQPQSQDTERRRRKGNRQRVSTGSATTFLQVRGAESTHLGITEQNWRPQ